MKLKTDIKAPDFRLLDQNGKPHSLGEYQGRWILVYFYPKDDTPGCTKEACAIRDNFPKFKKMDAVVLGISIDSGKSHEKFVSKYKLPFILLSDEAKEVVKKYGVWGRKKFMGREYMGTLRMSFLIDSGGIIRKTYENVKPEFHAAEVLKDLEKFKARQRKRKWHGRTLNQEKSNYHEK